MTIASLPASLRSRLASPDRLIGISGSRDLSQIDRTLLRLILDELAATPRPRRNIMVGDGDGVDRAVRVAFPECCWFQRTSNTPGGFAARSITFVRSVASRQAMLIALPSTVCPPLIWPTAQPSRAFNGSKAGTWSTIALAIGLQVPTWIAMPAGLDAPPWHQDLVRIDDTWLEANGGRYGE